HAVYVFVQRYRCVVIKEKRGLLFQDPANQ
ncbi:hypothetical protein AVEN_197266-1, partial [Araneus ventricosus]